MKTCSKCTQSKDLSEFPKNKARYDGVGAYCKPCNNVYHQDNRAKRLESKRKYYRERPDILRNRSKQNYRNDIEKRILYSAKKRAAVRNIPFNLDISDIVIPAICPILGIELGINFHQSKENSPSLDRVVPSKGYVKGNVIVVSMKANQIKSNATINELKAVYEFYKDKMPCV